MAMKKIKRDDEVVVIAGKDKGKRGKVLKVLDDSRLLVSGVQMIKKHMQDFLHKAIPKQKKKEWLGAGEFSRKKYSNENTNKPH